MHWVNRGPEPAGLATICARYTPRWVAYYQGVDGNKPSDSRWRDFLDDLCRAFSGLCAYCEERDKGEIDHFRPKSKFPERVYQWSNWIFACHNCNQSKREKWPPIGYADPCSDSIRERPENLFRFDTEPGEILPLSDLNHSLEYKAQKTIDDLSLNASHHLRERLEWLVLVSGAISGDPKHQAIHETEYRTYLASRTTKLSSITRAWLMERGYSVDA